jgi:Spy/CpxP family protein refolding chaperone
MLHWWRMHRRGGCSEGEVHAESGEHEGGRRGRHGWYGWQAGWHHGGDEFGGGSFGVRRPLRFLAFKLNLSEQQVAELAKVLDELKTERAQSAVDDRRTTAAFADALGLEKFDEAKAAEGGALRVKAAERLRDAVVKALGRIHAVLDQGQRAQLAYLIRTGALSI